MVYINENKFYINLWFSILRIGKFYKNCVNFWKIIVFKILSWCSMDGLGDWLILLKYY